MKKKLLLSLIPLIVGISVFAQLPALQSTKKTVNIFVDQKTAFPWRLSSEAKVDIYTLLNLSELERKVCFVSDCDSICFTVQNDTMLYFDIVMNQEIYPTAISVICSPQFPNTFTLTEKLYFLSQFWSEVKFNFVFFDELDFSWDSLYKSTIEEVIASKNDYDYYKILERFTASLKDGHTEIFNYGNFSLIEDYVPFLGKFFGDKFYVTYVTEPHDKIIPPGSQVLEFNGLLLHDHLQKNIYPYINSKSPSRIRMLAASLLFAAQPVWDSLHLRYLTPEKEMREHVFARDGESTRSAENKSAGYHPERPRERHRLTWHDNKIAQLNINTFYSNNLPYLDSLMDLVCDAHGLIIDLRHNGGGSTLEAFRVLERISNKNYFLSFGYQTRINDGVKRANGNWIEEYSDFFTNTAYRTALPDTIYIPDTVRKFTMPIIVLIGEFTFSAAEDFLIMLYEMENRPLLIGNPTGGSTGSPLVIATDMIGESLPDGGYARLCTRRVLFPESLKPFRWIEPDILVEYDSIQEYLLGKDKVLEVALEKMKTMKKN